MTLLHFLHHCAGFGMVFGRKMSFCGPSRHAGSLTTRNLHQSRHCKLTVSKAKLFVVRRRLWSAGEVLTLHSDVVTRSLIPEYHLFCTLDTGNRIFAPTRRLRGSDRYSRCCPGNTTLKRFHIHVRFTTAVGWKWAKRDCHCGEHSRLTHLAPNPTTVIVHDSLVNSRRRPAKVEYVRRRYNHQQDKLA